VREIVGLFFMINIIAAPFVLGMLTTGQSWTLLFLGTGVFAVCMSLLALLAAFSWVAERTGW
jgi:hypothetical protein